MFFNAKISARRARKSEGFTLIELLVVISIIGLLSSVILASLGSARKKARDAERVSNLKQLQIALENYYDDTGHYPVTSGAGWQSGTTVCESTYGAGHNYTGSTGYIPDLAPKYIATLPEDPNVGPWQCYLYRSLDTAGTGYKLLLWNTVENYDAGSSMADPGWGGTTAPCTTPRANTYSIYSQNAVCI